MARLRKRPLAEIIKKYPRGIQRNIAQSMPGDESDHVEAWRFGAEEPIPSWLVDTGERIPVISIAGEPEEDAVFVVDERRIVLRPGSYVVNDMHGHVRECHFDRAMHMAYQEVS